MEKINFSNNSQPALNSTNLNKLQDNVEDAMKSERTISDTDTYSCNYINQNNTYSTSETLTGKIWIDGKPIYRKCITLSNVNIGYVEQNHGISNVDNLISMVGTLEYNDKIQYIPNVVCDNIAGFGAGFVDFKKSGTFHTLFGTSISTTNTVHVIFEYTKTTDT